MANVELSLLASDPDYEPDDERWLAQVDELYEGLEAAAELRRRRISTPGNKSTAADIILALGSAGVVAAVVQVFTQWLSKGRKRQINLRATVDGKTTEVSARSEGLSAADLKASLEKLLALSHESPRTP